MASLKRVDMMLAQMRGQKNHFDTGRSAGLSLTRLAGLLLLVNLLISCIGQPNLLRYDNLTTCSGYFSANLTPLLSAGVDLSYGIPASEWAAGLQWTWLENDALFALYDDHNKFRLIDRSGELVAERDHNRLYWPNAVLSVSNSLGMYALFFARSGSLDTDTIEVYPIHAQADEQSIPLTVIRQLRLPVWHPTEPKLAGKYYTSDASTTASNQVAIFDINQLEESPTAVFDLDWSNVSSVFGWSADGELLAVNQYTKYGLVPVYIKPETGSWFISSIADAKSSWRCARDGKWSPSEQVIAFEGRTESTEGFDIFIEEVGVADRGQSVVTNLTNSPMEDEESVSWSPDGNQVAYVRGYLDESGAYQQELARIDLTGDALVPIQLTGTADEFETGPLWIAADEIAYLSWNHLQSRWYLKTLLVATPDQQPETVMEIPESWYRTP